MDDSTVALVTLIVTVVLVPLAKWIYGLMLDRAELRYYREDAPKVAAVLKESADTMRRQSRPGPYSSLHRRSPRATPRGGRSRRR